MFDDFKELLSVFNAHSVKYLIVGGMRFRFMRSRVRPRTLIFSSRLIRITREQLMKRWEVLVLP